jgi:hypothetical protein
VASAESLDGGCVLYRITADAGDRTVATLPERVSTKDLVAKASGQERPDDGAVGSHACK